MARHLVVPDPGGDPNQALETLLVPEVGFPSGPVPYHVLYSVVLSRTLADLAATAEVRVRLGGEVLSE
jgi:hypothetical protein